MIKAIEKFEVKKSEFGEVSCLDLYVAFKGTSNTSNKLVSNLEGEKLFLTNSFNGLRRDIENIEGYYNNVYMFGLDKNLKGTFRVEQCAVNGGNILSSNLEIETIVRKLNENGIIAEIGNEPKYSLCNEAYWYMLNKYCNKVIFVHVPSIKYVDEEFIKKIKTVFNENLQE